VPIASAPGIGVLLLAAAAGLPAVASAVDAGPYFFNDSHFHLTNYVQEGTPVADYVAIMGDKVGRSTLFGIPLSEKNFARIRAA